MHPSAMRHGRVFFETYCKDMDDPRVTIVDIGSFDVNGTLRSVAPPRATYRGLDFAPGNGVDVLIDDPYSLPIPDDSADVVVSSSCFEHSELFWLLFNEALRMLRPGGLLYVNAPSNGSYHTYPVDCYRFYPDAGSALEKWGRRCGYDVTLVESFLGEENDWPDNWVDFVAVFAKGAVSIDQFPAQMIDRLTGYRDAKRIGIAEMINRLDLVPDQEARMSLQSELCGVKSELYEARDTLRVLMGSRSYRAFVTCRRIAEKVAPSGTRRRAMFVAIAVASYRLMRRVKRTLFTVPPDA